MASMLEPQFVDDCPQACASCNAVLCLRKQVINLALGNVETMQCLECIAREAECTVESLLERMVVYTGSRQCFSREWQRYTHISHCPDRNGCFPNICFGKASDSVYK